MISMLIILAVFVGGIAGLAWLGRRVPHPDDELVIRPEWERALGELRRAIEAQQITIGRELAPVFAEMARTFAEMAHAVALTAAAIGGLGAAWQAAMEAEIEAERARRRE